MSKYIKIILNIALITGFFLTSAIKTAAQQPNVKPFMKVSPVILNISLVPGKEYHYVVTVENLLDSPLPLRATFEDFQTEDEEGGYVFTQKATSPLLSWITLDKSDLIIPAHAKETVSLNLTIPKTIKVGGYYGILFFQPVISNQQAQIPLSSKVGVLMLANVGVPSQNPIKGQIVEFSFDKFLYQKGPLSYLFRFRNTELNFYSAKPFLTLKPFIGKEQKFSLEEKFVFPGKTRRWEGAVELPNYWHGFYKATLAVSTGQGKQVIEESYLVALPYTAILVIGVSLCLLYFMITKKKRVQKALKILFSTNSKG